MDKYTLKILRCSHRKILKYFWPFYNIMHERVKWRVCLLLFVICASLAMGINPKSYMRDSIFHILKKKQSFLYLYHCCTNFKPSSWWIYSLKLPFITSVIEQCACIIDINEALQKIYILLLIKECLFLRWNEPHFKSLF